ncbi:MAG: aminotransferase class I/II-fold pyridoxal phosphate-dependent enzyme [Actinomycetota bacterium]|nr:aminotransferase class I/II-fold pyridoxal phosphate-dependent enzyme [Actinomycetota bacterium]
MSSMSTVIRDLSNEEARRGLVLKWGSVAPDVLPAWVAEMDYALAPVVEEAVVRAVRDGITGYPVFEDHRPLGEAFAGFARRHWGWAVETEQVQPVCDVTAGVRLALDVLSDPGPVVLPTPAYHPHLDVMGVTGRDRVDLLLDPDADRAVLDLDRLGELLHAGARTVLLSQPHNPWGRVFTREELEGLRDVVVEYGARVIADEIHAPLVLPGAEHVPYLSLDGTADHAVTVIAASKAFNTAGLRCAQIVTGDEETMQRLQAVSLPRNDSWSPLGEVAAITAYTEGDAWLAALVERLDQLRTLLGELLAEHLPQARMRPLEATYLAWLDARAYGYPDPAQVALEQARVLVSPGHLYAPGLDGHVRLNFATSPERLTEIVRRLAQAWTSGSVGSAE